MLSFYFPPTIHFGPGAIKEVGKEAKKLGKKAMLVTGSTSMRKLGVLDKVSADLKANGLSVVVFDRIEPNARNTNIDEGAKLARQEKVDVLIALGGGSVLDSTKAMGVTAAGTVPVWDYIELKAKASEENPGPATILVPTLTGSGSEGNRFAVIINTSTHDKQAGDFFAGRVSIIDPELTLTVPLKETIRGGLDIIYHSMEEYLITAAPNMVTDGILEMIMKTALSELPKVMARLDDIEARSNLAWVSTIAGSQIRRMGGGIQLGGRSMHEMSHAVSGYFNVTHADALAALTIAWMKSALPARKERFDKLAKNVFGTKDAVKSMEALLEKTGMRLRLRDLGVKREQFEAMAQSAMKSGRHIFKHPNLTAELIVNIYEDSY